MSRKLRIAKAQIGALPSPSWTYALLVGDDPGVRLPGWPQMYQEHCGEPDAAAVWLQHRGVLIALASQHDFEPYWLHSVAPTGLHFRRWRDEFLREFSY